MSKIDLYDPKWIEMVFEGKNKEYGAYKLRRGTSSRNIKALLILLIAAALIGGYLVYKIQADKAGIPEDAVSAVIAGATLYMPFAELVDISAEIERLTKEEARLQGEIKRSNGMLNNEKFISKAPAAKVQEEKDKLVKYEQMLKEVTERLASLKK